MNAVDPVISKKLKYNLPSILQAFTHFCYSVRGVIGRWAGWAIVHPVFGRIEGDNRQQWRAALLLALPILGSQLRPCVGKEQCTYF